MSEAGGPKNRGIDCGDIGSLFERFARPAFRYARMMGVSESDADDVVGESFLRALRARGTFRAEAEFSTWLLRIVRNTTLNLLRKKRRRQGALAQVAQDDARTTGADPPERELERREMLQALQKAIGELPQEQRSALSLVTSGGLCYREAARVEGISRGALTSRVYRARRAVIRRLEEMGMLRVE